jgi:hypothetical protein
MTHGSKSSSVRHTCNRSGRRPYRKQGKIDEQLVKDGELVRLSWRPRTHAPTCSTLPSLGPGTGVDSTNLFLKPTDARVETATRTFPSRARVIDRVLRLLAWNCSKV